YFVALAEQAEPELRGSQQQHWFEILAREQDNLRIALEWSLSSGEIATGLRIAGALHFFWFALGYHTEGYEWTQRLRPRMDEAPVVYQPKFLISAAEMATFLDLEAGSRLYARAIQAARSVGDSLQLAWALTQSASTIPGMTERAMSHAEEG